MKYSLKQRSRPLNLQKERYLPFVCLHDSCVGGKHILGSKNRFEIDVQFTTGDVDDVSSRLCVLGFTSDRIWLPQKPV